MRRSFVLSAFCLIASVSVMAQVSPVVKVQSKAQFLDPANVVAINGVLGEAIASERKGRLTALPSWNDGELLKIFGKEIKNTHDKTDWYGEHAGKWMYTTANAVRQSKDKELESLLFKTADYIVSTQEQDGYIGSYGPTIRFTNASASHRRSWDVWGLSCTTLGLLNINKYFPNEKYLNAAKGIGELFLRTFADGKNDITNYGTRHGISATIILDPVIELYRATGDKRYLELAEQVIKKMEETEGAKFISVGLSNQDMENVGDGKAYQILWNLTAIAKLYEVTGKSDYLKAVQNGWQNVLDHHLTITGGPWGGIGKHLECFNRKGYWSPYGFVETCSTMSWIQLNKELLQITGEAKYAQEIEKAAYNSLLGARYKNGVDWSYHSFNNGSWHIAHFNDCCPSSGVMALEELTGTIYSRMENGLAINLFTDSEAKISLGKKNEVRIAQRTAYPFDGKIRVEISGNGKESFPLFVRIPDWVTTAAISVNGQPADVAMLKKGSYFKLERAWKQKDVVEIDFPLELTLHQQTEVALAPQGGTDIYDVNWFAITRGPLVFAVNGLIDGKDRERVLQITSKNPDELFAKVPNPYNSAAPAFELKAKNGEHILFVPYYEAGEAMVNHWRLTWLQSKIE
jgi:DUF1680 family protein